MFLDLIQSLYVQINYEKFNSSFHLFLMWENVGFFFFINTIVKIIDQLFFLAKDHVHIY